MTTVPKAMLAGAAALLVLLAGFLWWTDRPGFRYGFVGNSQQCSVQQMVELPTDLDFVALGSSRVRRGIDQELAAVSSDGRIGAAFNLGRPGRNFMRTYTMFADVLERNPKLNYAYVEMDIEPLMTGRGARLGARADIGIMRYRDILLLYNANADVSQVERLHIVAEGLLKKVASSVTYLLSGSAFENYPRSGEAVKSVCWQPGFDVVSRKDLKEKRLQRRAMQKKYGDFNAALTEASVKANTPRAIGELYFLEKIRELAAAHHVKLIVSRHWSIYEPPLSNDAVSSLRGIIPEFAYPPADFIRKSWEDFIDSNHLGKHARQDFTRWMLSELLGNQLADAP